MPFPALLLFLLIARCSGASYQHYAALGISQEASAAEIRRSYRKMALKLHPDKNSSPAAVERWLRVQQAYEALTSGSNQAGSSSTFHQPNGRPTSHFWQAYQQQQQQQRIPSDTEELDAATFSSRVLASGYSSSSSSSDGAWMIQIFAHANPYCRVLSPHWEVAARELGGLLTFARIDAASQPMLVRFVASHLRLFRSHQHHTSELPAVFGLPAGCTSMSCAIPFASRFTAQGLQAFAASKLLRLPRLQPLSRRLLPVWRARIQAASRVAVLALLPEGQPPPPALVGAVAKASGRVQAAYAVWRPVDAAAWAADTGATQAPALVFWQEHWQRPVVVQGHSIDFAAEVERHSKQAVPALHAATAHLLPACQPLAGGKHGSARAAAGAKPPDAICVLLLGRSGSQLLVEVRGQLERLHKELSGHSGRRHDSPVARQAAKALSAGRLQLAWANARQQSELCRHIVGWSQGSIAAACLCGPLWKRLALAGVRQCSLWRQPPVLVAYQQNSQQQRQTRGCSSSSRNMQEGDLLLAAYPGSLSDPEQLADWLGAVAGLREGFGTRSKLQQVLTAAPPLPGQLAVEGGLWHMSHALLLGMLHSASEAELMWQRLTTAAGGALGFVSWRQVLLAGLASCVVIATKRLLDFLSLEEDDGGEGSSPRKGPASHRRPPHPPAPRHGSGGIRSGSKSAGVQQLRHSDWEPSPGRFLVLLPLPSGGGSTGSMQEQAAASAAVQRLARVAALFCRERRLAFRVAPVSEALSALLAGSEGSQAESSGQPLSSQEEHHLVVLHPRRGRFQLVPLGEAAAVGMRLDAVLDGGGEWRQAGGS